MSECFGGWRRKAGCALLVVTLVLTTAWLRSKVIQDAAFCTLAGRTYVLYSASGSIYFWTVGQSISLWPKWNTGVLPSAIKHDGQLFSGYGNVKPIHPVAVSYWFLIVPQTLLAGYLILQAPPKVHGAKLIESGSEGQLQS